MVKRQSTTNVSLAIRKTMFSYNNQMPLVEKPKSQEFTIKVANTLEEREVAFHLAYQVYLEKGYVKQNPNEMLIHPYDANPETVILIVQDAEKNIAGSITLVFDGSNKLPLEKIYKDEIKKLKEDKKRITEISRLVISPNYRNSKEILVLLFNYLCVYIHHIKNYDTLAIQVNPRHKNYYQTLLCFDEIGGEKACPQVQNAPAVLLTLPIMRYQSEVKRCHSASGEKKDRTLYPYFIKPEQESLVAHYLAKQTKPMTAEEKIYFGFTESGISRAVLV